MSRAIRVDRGFVARTFMVIGVFLVVVFGPLIWLANGGARPADGPLIMTVSVAVGGASLLPIVVSVIFGYYRCPQCRQRLPKLAREEVGSAIHYYCSRCNVEWDLVWRRHL